MRRFAIRYYDEDEYVHYTILQVSHSLFGMNCLVWIITFPDGEHIVLTDNLN